MPVSKWRLLYSTQRGSRHLPGISLASEGEAGIAGATYKRASDL